MLGYPIAYKQITPDPKKLQPLLDLPEPTCAKELKRVSGMFCRSSLALQCLSPQQRCYDCIQNAEKRSM